MKAFLFVFITLLSGAIAGTILGLLNQGLVEPYIERAIQIELQNAQRDGEMINPVQFESYRLWQRGGEIVAGTILGLSFGALFGLVYAYGRPRFPGSSEIRKALLLSALMWLTLFMLPALKYPANPPAVGDPETINYRQGLYITFVSISGLGALALGLLYVRMRPGGPRNVIVPAIYAAVMAAAFVLMPPNPDEIAAPMDLVTAFRIVSGATMTVFWVLLGLIMGLFWNRLKPHETARLSMT
jgi:predicted cobalt transporter CbtA